MCPACSPVCARASGYAGSRPSKPSALPCSVDSLQSGRMSSPLDYILCWRQSVLAPEEMVVSSDSVSGGTYAL